MEKLKHIFANLKISFLKVNPGAWYVFYTPTSEKRSVTVIYFTDRGSILIFRSKIDLRDNPYNRQRVPCIYS